MAMTTQDEQFYNQDTLTDGSGTGTPTGESGELTRMYHHIDQMYSERTKLVALVMKLCRELGYLTGMGKDPLVIASDWDNVAFFDLPSGQCSFHIPLSELSLFEGFPAYPRSWDGHAPAEKWERILNPQLVPWYMREWGTRSSLADTFKTQLLTQPGEQQRGKEEDGLTP